MKKIKKSKLQNQLFKKYLLGFIIFQILGGLMFGISMEIFENVSSNYFFFAEDIYEKVSEKGIDSIKLDKRIHKGAYIEVLNLDYKVKYSKNSPHKSGYLYKEIEIKDLLNDNIEHTKAFILSDTLEILIVNEQSINKTFAILTIAILLIALSFLATYIIFFNIMANIVSSTIEKPIESLMSGINNFKNKIYSSRISFSSGNELDDLKDTFNEMAMTLEREIKLREKAEQLNKQLILDITHDLKTPLTNIEGYCDLLMSNSKLSTDDKEKYLDIIMSNSKRTNSLMNDLFELTRIDHSGYNLEKTRIDFSELIRRILSEYITLFENESKDYELNIPDTSIYACIDKNSIDRAICNILDNFMNYSGNKTKLTLSLDETPIDVILKISDNGKGIEKSKCESIFLPFSRADTSRNSTTGGTGLGLAITKKIIEKHGGRIYLDSDVNEGFRFVIVIPKLI